MQTWRDKLDLAQRIAPTNADVCLGGGLAFGVRAGRKGLTEIMLHSLGGSIGDPACLTRINQVRPVCISSVFGFRF